MKTIIYLFILSIAAIILIAPIIGNIILSARVKRAARNLYRSQKNTPIKIFHYSQLEGLPEPVQRYFRHVLSDGQPYIQFVKITHSGRFKADLKKDWMNIKGVEYFTTQKPGFIWKGKTAMFTAVDQYIADKGQLQVSLFSLFKIVNAHGKKFDQGELLRWLAESVWFPTNLLPSKNLQWYPISPNSAQLNFKHGDLLASYIVTFNTRNEIFEMVTDRYMGDAQLEKWVCQFSNYKEMNGVLIPIENKASWRLKEGDRVYADFNLVTVDFDKPGKF
ncbi:MAG: hypothetical protein JWQ25_1450 [Daejeonella sp.]|nr:hypothetical protein [Daejeonella sp.]